MVRRISAGCRDDRGDQSGHTLGIYFGCRLAIDQETVASEDGSGFDALPPTQGANEIANGGHSYSGFWCSEARPVDG
jgi:hypothetical protein